MPLLDPGSPSSSGSSSKRTAYFVVGEAELKDVRRLVDIEFQAFENERTNQQLSYRDYTKPEHFERSVALYSKAISEANSRRLSTKMRRKQSVPRTTLRFLKVTDTETGEIVSFAKTEIKGYSAKELSSPADAGHENEPTMNRDWFALNEIKRRDHLGTTKHCYIAMLATLPRNQHEGAGTLLLTTILSTADQAGLECYLEGTDTAKSLYEKYDFRAVDEVRLDPAVYGVRGLGVERQTVMVRGASGAEDGVEGRGGEVEW
ncbi:hypothetical protein LTR62_005454 [Meristemomyces frigidus]|uniref:N-acetyltransferase domain-containing protein n=1 Tax=Meristemomyces frigidus TaxID=1508187 RepID=A0AAN7TDI2_9PEZI|nr:hypothetical protein LTR62_005454 [Meristemomyces frigidus]